MLTACLTILSSAIATIPLHLKTRRPSPKFIRALTKEQWTLDDLDRFAAFWRDAMR